MSALGKIGPRGIAVIVLIVTFMAGSLVGAAVERVSSSDSAEMPRRPPPDERRPGGPPPGDRGPDGRASPTARIFAEDSPLARRLNLTEDQREEIEAIIEEEREKAGSLLEELRPRLQARYDTTTASVLDVLTAEQRAEFDRLREAREQQIRRRFRDDFDGDERRPRPPF